MELDTFIQTVLALASGENLLMIFGAAACCLLTGLVKKLLPKLKIDLTHSFDPTVFMPFVFGAAISSVAGVFMSFDTLGARISFIAVQTLTMGALSMTLYKIVSGLSGKSLKQLLKSDAFSLFYNQLIGLTDAKKRLLDGTLSEKDFVATIQTLAANAGAIYAAEGADGEKKEKLQTLLGGLLDAETIDKVAASLHLALSKMFGG